VWLPNPNRDQSFSSDTVVRRETRKAVGEGLTGPQTQRCGWLRIWVCDDITVWSRVHCKYMSVSTEACSVSGHAPGLGQEERTRLALTHTQLTTDVSLSRTLCLIKDMESLSGLRTTQGNPLNGVWKWKKAKRNVELRSSI
jgi:hypothetical protein